MALQLYDTATKTMREFRPVRSGSASIYLCGATVQDAPHIGHVRGALNYDVLRRWLSHNGFEVTLVRNVTDIDDKIISKAAEADTSWWAWAAKHERAFESAFDALGCLPPAIAPRATGHITQMIELIQRLIDRGYAYPAGGDVYFAVGEFDGYGTLSGQRPDEVQQGEAVSDVKRDPRDFTLWKQSKPGEPSWPTPWGDGRPGWHLECSAMATNYLGSEFDIHGGGVDLVFPHHENERAQSHAAGDPFAQYWLHTAWVTLTGEKMSKSLGNVVAMTRMLRDFRAVELRYYLIQPHYRSAIEYSDEALAEAGQGYRRIEQFLRRVHRQHGEVPIGDVTADFAAALDNDLATPQAVAALHQEVRDGNAALDNADTATAIQHAGNVRAMSQVLGIDPLSAQWSEVATEGAAERVALSSLVEGMLARRENARAARDFTTADEVRDQLLAAGIAVEDTVDGPMWTVKED